MKNIFYQAPFITKVHPLWIILLALLLTSASCTKEEPKHRDVFRCEINGVPWEAGCDSQNLVWSCDYLDCQFYDDNGGFEIVANNKFEDTSSFHLHKSAMSGGISLGQNYLSYATFGMNSIQYKSDTCCVNVIEVLNINKTLKVIECRFQLKLISTALDTLTISNGYLQVKYRT